MPWRMDYLEPEIAQVYKHVIFQPNMGVKALTWCIQVRIHSYKIVE